MKKNYKMKKTISMKQFITEFGEDMTKPMKKKLLELWPRCILTRDEKSNILDLKHVEHIQYDCNSGDKDGSETGKKEYAYGQFIIDDGTLYFSEKCLESDTVMQMPAVDAIFDSLKGEEMYFDDGVRAKKVDDDNIDYVIDSILKVCPAMSQAHLDIISKYCSTDDFNNKNTNIKDYHL